MAFDDFPDEDEFEREPAHRQLKGRTRHTVDPKEMRNENITFRLSRYERDDFYLYARLHKVTMSFLLRKALEQCYPEVFCNANRYIREPKKKPKKGLPPRTRISRSFDGRSVSVDSEDPDE